MKYISFVRNFGHQTAIFAGMMYAKGSAVVTMDADLQDPPEVIDDLCGEFNKGFDVVYARRTTRRGVGPAKRVFYKLFYKILAHISSVRIPADVGDFRIVTRKVIDMLRRMSEQEKFLRGQIAWMGFRQSTIGYERDRRFAGKPGYSYAKLMRLAFDGVFSFSNLPLRVASVSGFIISLGSFVLAARVLYIRLFTDKALPEGFTTEIIAILSLAAYSLSPSALSENILAA